MRGGEALDVHARDVERVAVTHEVKREAGQARAPADGACRCDQRTAEVLGKDRDSRHVVGVLVRQEQRRDATHVHAQVARTSQEFAA